MLDLSEIEDFITKNYPHLRKDGNALTFEQVRDLMHKFNQDEKVQLKAAKEHLLTKIVEYGKESNHELAKARVGGQANYIINIWSEKLEERKAHLRSILDEILSKLKTLK